MSIFSDDELAYLRGQRRLARIATDGKDGTPHVVPVGMWTDNPEHDTIDVGGHDFEQTKKFGTSRALAGPRPPIRISPERIVSRGSRAARPASAGPVPSPRKELREMPIIKRDQLPASEIAHELVGAEHGLGIRLSFVDAEPGRGPALRRHPPAEVLIVPERGGANARRRAARGAPGRDRRRAPQPGARVRQLRQRAAPPDRYPPEPALQHRVARGTRPGVRQ
jgi:hypothetical protein